MPRVGRHPLKSKKIKNEPIVHQKVTVTTIVHIPMLCGYWENSLKVLELFFESLYANTNQDFDLMVFDNGSCSEVQSYLNELYYAGEIQYLIFSQQNLRKLGALNFLLSSAPGEYIAYADSDVYFLPGWLDESLEVLDAFPEAAKVTALPIVGGNALEISENIITLAQVDTSIEIKNGLLVSDKYVEAHRLSLGQSLETYSKRLINRKDVILKRKGIEALLSTADFQFVITKKAARRVLPLHVKKNDGYYDPIYSPILERKLIRLGFWQLSTPGYFVHHMGNQVPDFENELSWVDESCFKKKGITSNKIFFGNHGTRNLFRRFISITIFRRLLTKIHTLSYRWLYE